MKRALFVFLIAASSLQAQDKPDPKTWLSLGFGFGSPYAIQYGATFNHDNGILWQAGVYGAEEFTFGYSPPRITFYSLGVGKRVRLNRVFRWSGTIGPAVARHKRETLGSKVPFLGAVASTELTVWNVFHLTYIGGVTTSYAGSGYRVGLVFTFPSLYNPDQDHHDRVLHDIHHAISGNTDYALIQENVDLLAFYFRFYAVE